jgi:hypothetical protein
VCILGTYKHGLSHRGYQEWGKYYHTLMCEEQHMHNESVWNIKHGSSLLLTLDQRTTRFRARSRWHSSNGKLNSTLVRLRVWQPVWVTEATWVVAQPSERSILQTINRKDGIIERDATLEKGKSDCATSLTLIQLGVLHVKTILE